MGQQLYEGIARARTNANDCHEYEWDLSAFWDDIDLRSELEEERVLAALVRWSVCQERITDLAELRKVHAKMEADWRKEIVAIETRTAGLEKKLAEKRKVFGFAFEDDALESERQLAERVMIDYTTPIRMAPERIASIERQIVESREFVAQLDALTDELRSVRRPPLPDWLTGA